MKRQVRRGVFETNSSSQIMTNGKTESSFGVDGEMN